MWARAHACATPPSRVTEPPAFSIASTADLDAPATWKESFALSSPTPRIFTPSRGLETTPAATSVLTLPEPIPRPTRMRFLVEPSLSRISLSFMTLSSLLVDNAHEVLDLFDHAAHRRGVGKRRGPMELVELQADQRLALLGVATDRGPDLLNGDGGGCCLRLV